MLSQARNGCWAIILAVIAWCCSLGLVAHPLFAAEISSRSATASSSARPQPVVAPNPLPLNLTISPVTISLNAKPGQVITTQLKIRNNSGKPEALSFSLGSFTADETGEKPKLIDPSPDQDFMKWLTLSENNIVIPPNEWKSVNVTFAPPSDAALAYYYTLYVQRSAELALPGETKIEGSPAILILTNVESPQAKRELQLEGFEVEHPLSEFLPQTFLLHIRNSGNVHIAPFGNIFIDGQGKKDLAVLSINPSNRVVLPQSTRTFAVTWDDGFPRWNPEKKNNLIWDFNTISHFRAGKYTAHVLLAYDNGQRDIPIESYTTAWVIPWRFGAATLAIALFAGVGIFATARILWQSMSRRAVAASPQPPSTKS